MEPVFLEEPGNRTRNEKRKLERNSEYILGIFYSLFVYHGSGQTLEHCPESGRIAISGGVQDQTGQGPEEYLFWADVGLDDLWTFHSAWQGTEHRMKA